MCRLFVKIKTDFCNPNSPRFETAKQCRLDPYKCGERGSFYIFSTFIYIVTKTRMTKILSELKLKNIYYYKIKWVLFFCILCLKGIQDIRMVYSCAWNHIFLFLHFYG